MIVLIVRPTVYAFSFMLAAVLAGIALGSALVAPFIARRASAANEAAGPPSPRLRRDWPFILAIVQLLTGATALVSLSVLNHTNTLQQWFGPIVNRIAPDYLTYTIVTAVPAVLPASILLGIAFPIGLHVWAGATDNGAPIASRVGVFYSLNVAGAILGSLVAGFVLLPALGSRGSLVLVASVMFAGGLVLFLMLRPRASSRLVTAGVLALVFAGVAASRRSVRRVPRGPLSARHRRLARRIGADHRQRASAAGRRPHDAARRQPPGERPGRHGVVAPPHRLPADGGASRSEGRARHRPRRRRDGGGRRARHRRERHRRRALARRRPRRRILHSHQLRRAHAAEREAPRRRWPQFPATTDKKFDVVTADIVLPIHAGANNLYSAEYFQS